MKRFLLAVPMIGLLAACQTQTPEQQANTAAIVGTGAAIGAIVGDDNRLAGAATGAAAAGLGALLIDRANQARQCRYYNQRTGQSYVAPCQG